MKRISSSRGFSRRAFLRGTGGVVVALPLLESFGRVAHAQSAPVAKRFITVFAHGGEIVSTNGDGSKNDGTGDAHGLDLWRPASSGEALVLGPTHAGTMDPFVDQLLLLRGIDNMAGRIQGDYGGHHGNANATALTAANTTSGDDDASSLGPSIDQVLAARLSAARQVPFPSIDLEVEGHNYGSPFYRAANEQVSAEGSPRAAFDRIFAGVTTGEPDPALLRRRALKGSVLDGVIEGYSRFSAKLSGADRVLVDTHLEHLRSIELRISSLPPPPAACIVPGQPTGNPADQREIAELHADLLVSALRCGLSHVGTLNIADIITDWLPTPYGAAFNIGHSLGHAARDVGPTGAEPDRYQDFFDEIIPNRRWRQEIVARILQGLKDTPEGEVTMLDNSLLLFTSEFSMGAVHSVTDVPILLAGKAGGALRTGRHLNYNSLAAANADTYDYATTASTHNLFTSILHAFGFDDAHFGNDNAYVEGPLSGLT